VSIFIRSHFMFTRSAESWANLVNEKRNDGTNRT